MDQKNHQLNESVTYKQQLDENKMGIFFSGKRKRSYEKIGTTPKKVKKLGTLYMFRRVEEKALKALKEWKEKPDEVSDQLCSVVAKDIAYKYGYVYLGLHLGVPLNDIKIIEEDYKGDVRRVALETLVKWRQLFPSTATVFQLMKGLQHVERYDVINRLNDHFF